MCGICGIYGIEDKTLIEKMLLTLKHRGPDDRGIYTDSNISMGHARLSIIDLSERGHQPMSNETGEIWLSVNGEIYNFQELRASLEEAGHHFYSHSDSEVIIHAYEEYDLDFVKKLRGMFAFSLYDRKKHRLILARDPIGKKPLYYYQDGNILIYASEIKAILAAGIKPKINQVEVAAFLAYQYSLGDQTLFQGIKKVLAGNIHVIDTNEMSIHKYWDIQENFIHADEQYYQKNLRSLLEESTALRMVADVPIGAFLSGGIDSSAVVALARPHVHDKFHTFSVGFETFSELEYASIVSEHLDTIHHEQTITDKSVLQELSTIAWLFDEPLGDAAIINNYFLSKEAKKYVTVVLAGEGGDELFAGYSNYLRNLESRKILNFKMLNRLGNKVATLASRNRFLMSNAKIKRIADYAHYQFEDNLEIFHQNTTRSMGDVELYSMFNLPHADINSLAILPTHVKTPLGRMLAMDCKNLLPEKFLMKSDKGTMANSIEERLPLLDKNVIEFAFAIPEKYKIHNNVEKYIFRKSIGDLLPEKIVKRPKQGFGTTTDQWMENELFEVLVQTIDEGRFLNEIMNGETKAQLVQNIREEIKKSSLKVWSLFALELWHSIFFENFRNGA